MSQKDDMIIRFSGLKPGVYNYGFDLADEFFEEYENDEIAGGKVKIDVVMERMEHMLMFTFRLNGEVTTFCDRCLGKMNVPVDGEEHLCVRFSDTETTDDENVVILPENAFERIRCSAYPHATHPPRRRLRPGSGQVHRRRGTKKRR
jgi:hypothetical protein